MRRRVLHKIKEDFFPDFTGYNLTRLFSFFKPAQATIDYAMIIYDSIGARSLYVFFDNKNEISLNSPLSTTTTPTSEVLGDLVIGTINIEATSIFCLISGLQLSKTTFGAYLVQSGVLCTRNGRTCLRIPPSTVGGFVGSALSELNNSFTSLAKHYNADVIGFNWGSIIQASTSTWATYIHLRPKSISSFCLRFRGGSTTYDILTTSDANAVSVNTIGAVNKNVEMSYYENGSLVDTLAISGNLSNNSNFVIAKRYSESIGFNGDIQLVGISTDVFDATKSNDFNTILNKYFK